VFKQDTLYRLMLQDKIVGPRLSTFRLVGWLWWRVLVVGGHEESKCYRLIGGQIKKGSFSFYHFKMKVAKEGSKLCVSHQISPFLLYVVSKLGSIW